MQFFTDDVMSDLLAASLETAALDENGFHDVGTGPGSTEGASVDWLTIDDLDSSVVDDVTRIRNHPLVPADIPVYGYVDDVSTGLSRTRSTSSTPRSPRSPGRGRGGHGRRRRFVVPPERP